jgi:hypothetical protein
VPNSSDITAFLHRWSASGAAERANAQSFINGLCGVVGVERPQPKTGQDLRGAKTWDVAMDKARAQAERYARSLPREELADGVAEIYGWSADLPEAEILERLVQLNAQRAAEEAAGHIRWFRLEYQWPAPSPASRPSYWTRSRRRLRLRQLRQTLRT